MVECFIPSTDPDGNFRVGNYEVEQASGIIINPLTCLIRSTSELSLGGVTLGMKTIPRI